MLSRIAREQFGCSWPSDDSNDSFIFVTGAVIATATLGLSPQHSSAALAGGVSMSCLPLIIPTEQPLSFLPRSLQPLIADQPKRAASRILTLSGLNLSFSFVDIFLGDPVSGLCHLILSGFGFYIVKPDGLGLLPTFTLVTFVNALMESGKLFEVFLSSSSSSSSSDLLTGYLNMANAGHPVIYALSCYYSWTLVESLRDSLLNPSMDYSEPNDPETGGQIIN
jgi:hypothetical protein